MSFTDRHISTIHKPKMHTTMGFWNRKPMESMMHIILQKDLFKSWNSTVVENDMFCQRQLFWLSFQICRVSDFTVQNFHKGPSINDVTHFLRFWPLPPPFTTEAYGVKSPFSSPLLSGWRHYWDSPFKNLPSPFVKVEENHII